MIFRRVKIVSFAACVAAVTFPSLRGQTTVPAASDSKSDTTVKLTPFEVSATRDEGYVPSETLSGTKVRTPLREIPMNIQVVTADFIQDTGALDLAEAMAYNASVTVSANAYQATIRGFSSDWQLRNGFRYYKKTDTTKVARIETISGPAAVLYGISQPGGILNVITKQPTGDNSGWLRETYSSQRERVDGEFNYRLTDKVSLLLVGAYEGDTSDTAYNNTYFRTLSPTLSWQLTRTTKLVVDYDWTNNLHHFTSGFLAYNGVPIQAPVSEGGFGIPQSVNYEGPDNVYAEKTRTLFITLEQQFGENASLRLAYNKHNQDSMEDYMGIGTIKAPAGNAEGIPAGTPSVEGTWRNYTLNNSMQSFSADGLIKFDTGPVHHQILVGGQVGVDKFFSPRYYDVIPGTNDYMWRYWSLTDPNPDLRKPPVNYVFQNTLSSQSRREENTVASLYLTHQGRFWNDRLITLAGVFYSSIDDYIRAFDGESQRYAASKVSPQFGAVVKVIDPVSLYALYATSLYPQAGGSVGGFGQIFPPVKGESFEYGLKFDLPDPHFTGTLSIYDIRQKNRVIFDDTAPNALNPTADPNLPRGANVPTGETMSKGVDLSLYYQPIHDVQIIGSYAYNNTEILHDSKAYLVGRKVTPFYRDRVAVWTKYSPSQVKGLAVGVGLTWHGEAIRGYSASSATGIANSAKAEYNAQAVVAYTRKLFGHRTTFAIDGRNLLRSETVTAGKGDLGYYFATPTEVRASVRVAF